MERLTENVTSVAELRMVISLYKYYIYLALAFASVVTCALASVAICLISKHSKTSVLFEGFNFACFVNGVAAIYQCLYSIHLTRRGVFDQMSRLDCALHACFTAMQAFSKTAIAALALATSVERYLALLKPIVFSTLSFKTYLLSVAVIYLCAFGKVVVLYAWLFFFDSRNSTVSPFCVAQHVWPTVYHYFHVAILFIASFVSVALHCTSLIVTVWRLHHSPIVLRGNTQIKKEVIASKRLTLATVNFAFLMTVPTVMHSMFASSRSVHKFLWFLWFLYDLSLLITILLYCWYQKIFQNCVQRLMACRISPVSPQECIPHEHELTSTRA